MALPAGVRLPAIPGATAAMSSLKQVSAAAGGGAAASASAPAAAASARAASPTGAAASSFCTFADQPDQLLCAPDNSVWVYGQYTLSYFTSEAVAQVKLGKRVRLMMREAQRHYDVSCAYFHSLSSEDQMTEVLRDGGGSGLSGPLALPASAIAAASRREAAAAAAAAAASHNHTLSSPTGIAGAGDNAPAFDDATASCTSWPTASTTAAAAERHERQRVMNVCRALREAWPAPRSGLGATDLTTPATTGADDDDDATAAAAAVGAGTSSTGYAPGLRVNIVLDIVASRKTIGNAAGRSRPYRLAEYLYQHIMGSAPANTRPSSAVATSAPAWSLAPHVRTLVIGISDVDTTLVGAHVVCPYRHVASPSLAVMRLRRAIETAAEQARAQAAAAASAGNGSVSSGSRGSSAAASAVSGGGVGGGAASPVSGADEFVPSPLYNIVAAQLPRLRRVDALLPSPYVRVPPTALQLVDQSRLILCAPGRQQAEV